MSEDFMFELEQAVKAGVSLTYWRQKRGYHLHYRNKKGKFEVIQGMSGHGGDKKEFKKFSKAYDWLLNGTPPNYKGGKE